MYLLYHLFSSSVFQNKNESLFKFSSFSESSAKKKNALKIEMHFSKSEQQRPKRKNTRTGSIKEKK